MEKNKKVPHNDYSVDEILAEAQLTKEHPGKKPEESHIPNTEESKTGVPSQAITDPDSIARQARDALTMEAGREEGSSSEQEGAEENRRKKHWPFLKRKKKQDFKEEEDIYYGLQLRPLEEYRREYEESLTNDGEKDSAENREQPQSSFPYLFGKDSAEPDTNLSETFERVHQERQKRLEKIMRQAGLEEEELFGQEIIPPHQPDVPSRPEHKPEIEPSQPPIIKPGPNQAPEIRPPVTEPAPNPPTEPDIRVKDAEKETEAGTGYPSIPKTAVEETGAQKPEEEEDKAPEEPLKAEEQPPASIKEPLFSPPPEKEEQRTPPPIREPDPEKQPSYRVHGGPATHVIDLECFSTVLAQAATCYQVKPREPIPFLKQAPPEEPAGNPSEPAPETKETEDKQKSVSVSVEPVPIPLENKPEPEGPTPEKKKKFRLFGGEEPDDDTMEDFQKPQEDELDDYTGPADEPSVLHDLISDATRITLRLVVTGIITVILLGFSLAAEHPVLLTPELHTFFTGQPSLIVHIAFLFLAAAFSFPAIWSGLSSLCTFKANADSAVSIAVMAAICQNILLLVLGHPDGIHLYSALAAMALFLNTAGKFSMMKRILHNFRYITSKEKKYAVRIFNDYNTALKFYGSGMENEPQIAYQSEAGFLKHFLRLSYTMDPSDHTSQILGPVGFIASLVLCGICAFLSRSAVNALTVLSAAACICVPFTGTLSVNLPLARLSRIASRNGAMLTGWASVDHFSDVNAVMVDAKDLFPRGTVILNGIKTFAGQRIDDAILDATALVCSSGGPLSDLFDQIIKSRRDLLPKITETAYEDGCGVTGMVSGHQILVGNRELLKAHDVEPPSRDYEKKYLANDKKLIYLASSGILVAVFILSYHSDRRRALELRRLEYNGINLIVRTNDPNITPRLLSGCFGISENTVTVLTKKLGKIYDDLKESPPDRTEALLATRGHATSMMRLLAACVRQRGNISVAVALQNTAVALGFALVAFLSVYSGLHQLSLTALLIYEIFWTAAIVFVPRLRRP